MIVLLSTTTIIIYKKEEVNGIKLSKRWENDNRNISGISSQRVMFLFLYCSSWIDFAPPAISRQACLCSHFSHTSHLPRPVYFLSRLLSPKSALQIQCSHLFTFLYQYVPRRTTSFCLISCLITIISLSFHFIVPSFCAGRDNQQTIPNPPFHVTPVLVALQQSL